MVMKSPFDEVNRGTTPRRRFYGLVAKTRGCWLWTGAVVHQGYGRFWFAGDYVLAHRFAAMLDGRDPSGLCVCHHCDVRLCVNPAHLFLGTSADNTADMVNKGRQAKGERTNVTPLRPSEVVKIRRLRRAGAGLPALAARFGVSRITIHNIEHRKTWAHIP